MKHLTVGRVTFSLLAATAVCLSQAAVAYAGGGNSANAQLCQQGGWQTLVDRRRLGLARWFVKLLVVSVLAVCAASLVGAPVASAAPGTISTVAGDGTAGYSGDFGTATSAELNEPDAVAVDAAGDLLISDYGDSRVRSVLALNCPSSEPCPLMIQGAAHPDLTSGDIYTVAGNGTNGTATDGHFAAGSPLDMPTGVAVDLAGDLLIGDSGEYRVRLVAQAVCASACPFGLANMSQGDIYTVPGGPAGVAVDSAGNLLTAAGGGDRVELVAGSNCSSGCPYGLGSLTAGATYTIAGNLAQGFSGEGGPATSAELYQPDAVTVDSAGNVLIADTGNMRVRFVAESNCSSSCPYGLTSMTAGDIYTVAGDGTMGYSGDGIPAASAELNQPYGVAVDPAGDLLIGDAGNGRVRLVADSNCLSPCPYGLPSMTKGDIYTIAGDGTYAFSGDGGPATSAGLGPEGVAVDSAGDLLIADEYNDRVRFVVYGVSSPGLSATASARVAVDSAISESSVLGILSGGSSAQFSPPTGSITFKAFGPQATAPSSCISGGTTIGTATVSGDGTYNPSTGFTPHSAGDYWWYASYAGDSNNNSAASTCGVSMAETVVGKASPTLSVTAPKTGKSGHPIAGSSVAAALGRGSSPTGKITFRVFGPQSSAPHSCSSGGTVVGTATVSGDKTYHPSAGFTPRKAGDYWWQASYGGDANNKIAVSRCGPTMAKTAIS